MTKLYTPLQAIQRIEDDLYSNTVLSLGIRTKIKGIITEILDRTDLDEKEPEAGLEGLKALALAFGPKLEEIKTDEQKAKEHQEAKTAQINKEIRDLWAGVFIAYTQSSNAVHKASAKLWADEAINEYRDRFIE
jgi:hypothetical protein